MNTPTTELEVIAESEWMARSEAHHESAREFTAGPRTRRDRGERHPVEDFLFEYYPYPFALIEQWHPGHGKAIRFSDPESLPVRFKSPKYRIDGDMCYPDGTTLSEKQLGRLGWIESLLRATRNHLPNFACHGLHEWAMVYRAEEVRHSSLAPLRLPQEQIDELIRSRPIACTHHDAFRFFAKDAKPLNRLQPSLETRHENEQPGCVHANMDLYKWAAKAMPWVGSELLLEMFQLASELRDLDMRASPYDLSEWKVKPVKIETQEGRVEYETEQRRLAEKARLLRAKLIASIERVLAA
jgi:hypothetical protein